MAETQANVNAYLQQKQIPVLFEALMAGIMYNQPEDPVAYIQQCLTQIKDQKSTAWDQFISNKVSTDTVVAKTDDNVLNAVFVLGGPGSGKGTQCAHLVQDYGIDHVSVGDLLRDEVKNKTEIGVQIDEIMKEGKMVPLDFVLNLLKARLSGFKGEKMILIDGFPREMKQAIEFEQKVGKVKGIFFFDCSEDTMVQRLTKRGETSGRADDNVDTIKKRLVTFREQSMPVVEYFANTGRLFRLSSERSPDDVYRDVQAVFEKLNK